MNVKKDEITLKGLLDIFLPKIWFIVIVAAVCGALLGGYSLFLKEDQYTSTASFVMVKVPTKYNGENQTGAINTGLNANEIEAMQAIIGMSERVMKTGDFLNTVKTELVERDARYESVSLSEIKNMLTIKVVGEATCFDITTVSTDSRLAFDVNEIVYLKFPDVIEEVFDSYAIQIKIIDQPLEAKTANSKNTARNAILGAIAGACLAAVVVFIISRLDVVVRTREDIENNFDIPILGVIPRLEFDD